MHVISKTLLKIHFVFDNSLILTTQNSVANFTSNNLKNFSCRDVYVL